jgi:hypothetical protein
MMSRTKLEGPAGGSGFDVVIVSCNSSMACL